MVICSMSSGLPGSVRKSRVGAVSGLLLGGLRNAEQHPDRAHRNLRAEIGDKVEAPRTHQRVESPRAEIADLRFQRVHLHGREDPRENAAVDGVLGRILEDHDSRRHFDVRLDELEH